MAHQSNTKLFYTDRLTPEWLNPCEICIALISFVKWFNTKNPIGTYTQPQKAYIVYISCWWNFCNQNRNNKPINVNKIDGLQRGKSRALWFSREYKYIHTIYNRMKTDIKQYSQIHILGTHTHTHTWLIFPALHRIAGGARRNRQGLNTQCGWLVFCGNAENTMVCGRWY